MKKLIQICSLLGLLVVFSAVSATAQTVSSYKADIPFDFNIGEKSYQSGSYVIKTTKISDSSQSLTLEDEKGNRLQAILVAASGDVSKKQPELIFNRYENQRYLTKLTTQNQIISIAMSGGEKRIARQMQEKGSRTQIALAVR